MLTKIETLDQRFPGLAGQVRKWFDQGIPQLKVVDMLRKQYGVAVAKSTLGNFRARRWVREREAAREMRLGALAIEELVRELEMKGSAATDTVAIQAKLTSFFLPDKRGRVQPIAATLMAMRRRLLRK
jgi:hypothetical protein